MRLRSLMLACVLLTAVLPNALAVKKANHQSEMDAALMFAALEGDLSVSKILLEHGARVHQMGPGQDTPLHRAIRSGNKELVTLYLDYGADLYALRDGGISPLHEAAEFGFGEIAGELLIRGKANLDQPDMEGRTPLHLAALWNHEEAAKVLLETEARVDVPDVSGRTALHLAAWEGHRKLVSLLLSHQARIAAVTYGRGPLKNEDTALHFAAFFGYTDLVKDLVEKDAPLNAKNRRNQTPLYRAVNHEDLRVYLIEKGARE